MSSKPRSPQRKSREKINPPPLIFYPQPQKSYPYLPYSHTTDRQQFKSFTAASRQPHSPLQIKRKSSQINTLHEQYNILKYQMKKMPEKNISIENDSFIRGKEKSKQFYAEDQKQFKSQSSQQHPGYRKTDFHLRKHESIGEVQYSKYSKTSKNEEPKLKVKQKKYEFKRSEAYENQSKQSRQKDSSSSSQVNTYLNKNNSSFQSSPPLPNKKKSQQVPSGTPNKKQEALTEKQPTRISLYNTDRPNNTKIKLQKFQMHIDSNMEAILQKFEDLEKKYLSLDLYFEQLKQSVCHRRSIQTQNKQISQAKYRQYKFLIGQYETKVKQLKIQNQRLQKEVLTIRIKQEQNRLQIQQTQQKLKSAGRLEQNYEKLKKAKSQADRKLIEYQSKINQLEKQKNNLQSQLQRQKLKKHYDLQHSTVKQEVNASHFISNSTLFGPSEDTDYLKQQISKLQYENKEYQKLVTKKSFQITNLIRSNTQSKMMMQKIKQLNEELQKQCEKVQRDNIQKQVEATQKMCNLNNSIKKKLKQYDNFKDLIVQCLDQVYKKAPKKIRKTFDGEIANKNRTNKCEVMFKCVNASFTYYQDQINVLLDVLLKQFSISSIQMDKLGLQACMKKVKEEVISYVKIIDNLKVQNKNWQSEVQKLKEQVIMKNDQLILKQEQQNFNIKKRSSQNNKKDIIPTNDIDPKQSITNSELSKKKMEIEKLNKENNRLIEESHQKYLKYQEQIANLQMKEKQYNSKILQYQIQRKQYIQKILEKDTQLKTIEKSMHDIKVEKDSLTIRIAQLNNENKKGNIQNQNKLHKHQAQIQSLKKKMKKMKIDSQHNEKTLNAKITVKDKTISELLQQKKKNTVQSKILTEKLQFAKIMQEAKEKQPPKKIEQQPLRFSQQQKQYLQTKISTLNQKIITQGDEIKNLSTIIKSINITLSEKEKYLQKTQLQLRRKEQQIDNHAKESKQKDLRKNHINEQYKKIVQQIKRQKQELEINHQQQKQKRNKEVKRITKQIQSKQEQIASLIKQKSEQTTKFKENQLKLSQIKRQSQELISLIHKRQYDLQQKQSQIKQEKQANQELMSKNQLLQQELLQRQEYFKKSQILMQQLISQNQQSKQELSKKQQQILSLIKQRQQLNFRLSQDLDAKSQNIKMVKFNHQNQLMILKEQLEATQMNLETIKQELKIKNNLIAELKQKQNSNKKDINTTGKQTKQYYEAQIGQCKQQIQNLGNKIDILQEELQETKIKLQDRQQQMDSAKRQKNKYYKILQQKEEYIEELQQAVKIKFNEVDQMKESQEEYEEIREQYQQNQQKMKKEIQQLSLVIKQLQDKSIQTVNQLKKEISHYQQEIEQQKEKYENQIRKKKITMSEKDQLIIENKKKDTEIMNLIQKYQELKIKVIEERQLNRDKSYLSQLNQQNQLLQAKQKFCVEIQQMKEQIEDKNNQIQTLQKKITSIQKINQQNSLKMFQYNKNIKNLEEKLVSLQRQKANLLIKCEKLQSQLSDKLHILQNLNLKIETMDNNINELQIKLDQFTSKNKQLQARLQSSKRLGEERQPSLINIQLQQKIKQIDEKDYQIQQIKQQHKKALKNQLNQYSSNLQSYRSNYTILQKQLNTYKEVNIVLTLKCQSLQKQYKQLQVKKNHQKNFIVSQSPNQCDFASVQFDLPQRQHLLKNLLSESWQNRFSIISQVVNEKIQIHEVTQSANHHYDQPFEICEQSNFSWPSLQIRQNNDKLIRSQYLQRLQNQIHQILINKQQSFGPSFYNLHSNSGLDILNCIRYQLVQYKGNMKEFILQQLQFIDNHQIDFCQNIQEQIQQFIQQLQQKCTISTTQKELEKKLSQWQHEKQSIKLNVMRQSHKYKEDIRISQENRQKLLRQLQTLNMQFKLQQSQIQDLIDKKEEEMEQQERYFMSQSQILRKQLAKENSRADKNQCNYLTVKKAIEKLLEILSNKQDKSEELQDAFEHISKICDEKDEKLKKSMESYLLLYSQEQQRKKNSRQLDQKSKKKKGFFGFN